jgi:hypothetical protein
MAKDSKSSLVFQQRLGIMEPVAATPARRVSFDTLPFNARPILVDEAIPAEILNAERQSDRQSARVFKIRGAVVISTV